MEGAFVSAIKGSNLMAVADGRSVSLGVSLVSASSHETILVEKTVDQLCETPEYLVGDKAYDFDVFRARRKERDIELVAPPRRNKRIKLQDGRAPRRYRRSWKIDRTIAWFCNLEDLSSAGKEMTECFSYRLCANRLQHL